MLAKYGLVKSDFGSYNKLEAIVANPKATEDSFN